MNNLKALIVAIAVANSHAFLGNKLPDVIDLYANFLEIFDGAKHFPSKKELGLVEAYNLNLGFVKMSPVTCGYNSAYDAADPCYYAISMGNVSHVENFQDSFDLPEMMQFYSYGVPVLNGLVYVEGSIEAAKQLVEEGVDFVAIATSSPSCSAGFTPEYVFSKPPNNYYVDEASRDQAFRDHWDVMTSFIKSTNHVNIQRVGDVKLNKQHHLNLNHTLHKAYQHLHQLFKLECTPVLKAVTTACKPAKVHALFGKSGHVYSVQQLEIKDVILPKINSPENYFSAIVGCVNSPFKMFYM